MSEQIEFLNEKPLTLVNYGKVIILNELNQDQIEQGQMDKADSKKEQNTQQILNVILPPLFFKNEENQQCFQRVESTPSKISDIVILQQKLDEQLQRNQAKEVGICPIREKLFGECFDELIRQITVNCSHRGIMLVRVRDELRNTLDMYQQLYICSLNLGVQTSYRGINEQNYLENSIIEYEEENQRLEREIEEIKESILQLDVKEIDEIKTIEQEFENSVIATEKEHSDLKSLLKTKFSLFEKKTDVKSTKQFHHFKKTRFTFINYQ